MGLFGLFGLFGKKKQIEVDPSEVKKLNTPQKTKDMNKKRSTPKEVVKKVEVNRIPKSSLRNINHLLNFIDGLLDDFNSQVQNDFQKFQKLVKPYKDFLDVEDKDVLYNLGKEIDFKKMNFVLYGIDWDYVDDDRLLASSDDYCYTHPPCFYLIFDKDLYEIFELEDTPSLGDMFYYTEEDGKLYGQKGGFLPISCWSEAYGKDSSYKECTLEELLTGLKEQFENKNNRIHIRDGYDFPEDNLIHVGGATIDEFGVPESDDDGEYGQREYSYITAFYNSVRNVKEAISHKLEMIFDYVQAEAQTRKNHESIYKNSSIKNQVSTLWYKNKAGSLKLNSPQQWWNFGFLVDEKDTPQPFILDVFSPKNSNIIFDYYDEEAEDKSLLFMQAMIIHIGCTLKLRNFEVKIIDCDGNGKGFSNILSLGNQFCSNNIIDNDSEFRNFYEIFRDEQSKRFSLFSQHGVSNIVEYNELDGVKPVSFQFVLIENAGLGLNDESMKSLFTLMKSGSEVGYFPMMHIPHPSSSVAYSDWVQRECISDDLDSLKDYHQSIVLTFYKDEETSEIQFSIGKDINIKDHKGEDALYYHFEYCNFSLPDDSWFKARVKYILEQEQIIEIASNSDLDDLNQIWYETSEKTLDFSIGVNEDGSPIDLQLNDKNPHALIGGRSGSGKSVLLHNVVLAGAKKYSPDELKFVILDYKDGIEFAKYQELSNIEILGIENERDFGRKVLEYLVDTISQRNKLFKRHGVENLEKYRKSTGRSMPRLVVIIDEFQVLLTESDIISDDCRTLFDDLARRGRSTGIHMILSSQTIANVDIQTSTMSQFNLRIALQLGEDDCARFFGTNNLLPASFSKPGEAVYNERSGATEGNVPFQGSFIDEKQRFELIDKLSKVEKERKFTQSERYIFEGHKPLHIGPKEEKKLLDNINSHGQLLIGKPNRITNEMAGVNIEPGNDEHLLIVGSDEIVASTLIENIVVTVEQSNLKFDSIKYFKYKGRKNSFNLPLEIEDADDNKIEVLSSKKAFFKYIQGIREKKKSDNHELVVISNFQRLYSLIEEDYSVKEDFEWVLKNADEVGIYIVLHSEKPDPVSYFKRFFDQRICLKGVDPTDLLSEGYASPIQHEGMGYFESPNVENGVESVKFFVKDDESLF